MMYTRLSRKFSLIVSLVACVMFSFVASTYSVANQVKTKCMVHINHEGSDVAKFNVETTLTHFKPRYFQLRICSDEICTFLPMVDLVTLKTYPDTRTRVSYYSTETSGWRNSQGVFYGIVDLSIGAEIPYLGEHYTGDVYIYAGDHLDYNSIEYLSKGEPCVILPN